MGFCKVGKLKRGDCGEICVVIHLSVINDILSRHIIPPLSATDIPAQLYFPLPSLLPYKLSRTRTSLIESKGITLVLVSLLNAHCNVFSRIRRPVCSSCNLYHTKEH